MPTLITKNNLSDTAIASIAAGFASRSDVSIDDILTLVERLMAITPEAGTRSAPKSKAIPATPAEQKMTQDTIFCLCCGKGFKMLKRHLGAEHGLTEEEYRVMFDLSADTPLVAPSYSKRKAEYAKSSGLGKYTRDKFGKSAEIS
ncbi:MucR family transcriptional regulator [Sulfitobacter sp. CW3]|uniref:MucR family transcriptional regulator n=1 Tax=Sulfitobacter sp. CW3 TaxID=2861965 RepID=UPI001C5E3DC3|nr:MucR family transcriptional regulator [Sulfitobacter sp. CW3]MBW4961667.1 MucR family transcriptional regulator [Sulfitobacter sp. CW3]